MADAATAYLFQVSIDGHDIGLWTECSGLSAQYQVEEYEEGGQNMFVHKLPGRLKFDNVKLKRAIDQQSGLVASWFASVHASSVVRTTASIAVLDPEGATIADWHLIDVVPVRWSGPSFKAGQSGLAEEELELAHHGFI